MPARIVYLQTQFFQKELQTLIMRKQKEYGETIRRQSFFIQEKV